MENIDFSLFETFELKLETTEVETTEVEAVEHEENKTSDFILTFPQNFLEL